MLLALSGFYNLTNPRFNVSCVFNGETIDSYPQERSFAAVCVGSACGASPRYKCIKWLLGAPFFLIEKIQNLLEEDP